MRILITGGAGGLGFILAERFLKEGHRVYVLDTRAPEEIDPEYRSRLSGYFRCDLAVSLEIETGFRAMSEKAKGIDVLINNASFRRFGSLEDFGRDEIERHISVDLLATIQLSRLCLPLMKANHFGRIINISSISAFHGYASGALYCSAKRALLAFTESLGRELKNLDGVVTVNAVCPGSFSRTDGTRMKHYRKITSAVAGKIEMLIRSNRNGGIIAAFPLRQRIIEALRMIRSAAGILRG